MHSANGNLSPVEFKEKCYLKLQLFSILYSEYELRLTYHNFSLPPVLLNAIAWVSRVGGDFRKLFTLKSIQLATSSVAEVMMYLTL